MLLSIVNSILPLFSLLSNLDSIVKLYKWPCTCEQKYNKQAFGNKGIFFLIVRWKWLNVKVTFWTWYHVKATSRRFPGTRMETCYHCRSMRGRRAAMKHGRAERGTHGWLGVRTTVGNQMERQEWAGRSVTPVPFISNILRIDKYKIHNGISRQHNADPTIFPSGTAYR